MKWLLLILVVAAVFYAMGQRRARRPDADKEVGRRQKGSAETPGRSATPPSDAAPVPMLRCTHCGVHLPAAESLPGQGGQFCSASHRAEYEARHGRSS